MGKDEQDSQVLYPRLQHSACTQHQRRKILKTRKVKQEKKDKEMIYREGACRREFRMMCGPA